MQFSDAPRIHIPDARAIHCKKATAHWNLEQEIVHTCARDQETALTSEGRASGLEFSAKVQTAQ